MILIALPLGAHRIFEKNGWDHLHLMRLRNEVDMKTPILFSFDYDNDRKLKLVALLISMKGRPTMKSES